MKSITKTIFLAGLLFLFQSGTAQTVKELQETARTFMQQGDFTNAFLVLNKATSMEPQNIEITKDLALNYYFQREYTKGLNEIKPVLDREDADDQSYQIAGNIYRQLDQEKECEKLYRKGIKRFPKSGLLYNELGELLWGQKNTEAIVLWEKGIETDPNFSKNYYNATKYYYLTGERVWSILYAEVFLNLEPLNKSTPEIKSILLESYKKIFAEAIENKDSKQSGKFKDAFIQTIKKQSQIASTGINPESLTMIRARFILDWYQDHAAKYPSRLFDLQRQLLQDGMFDAYNQWLFGTVQNLAAYQNWISTHSADYNDFTKFQRGRMYKVPPGQYYHQ
ncbi:MAG: hypothetical protein WKI04_13230 [Ferruginibacter sp.]